MSQPRDPWTQRAAEPLHRPPGWAVLVVRVVVFLAIAYGLPWLFPEVHLGKGEDWYLIGLGLVIAWVVGNVYGNGFHIGHAARNVAIWTAVVVGLALLYTLSHGSADLGARLQSAFQPSEPVSTGRHTLVLTANEQEEFTVTGLVNGTRVRFAVDTGASDIVLSPDDAKRAGIDIAALHYTGHTLTANGEGRVAYTHVTTISVGSIPADDLVVAVNSVPMDTSLLGMSFLKRLKSFQIEGRTMTLTGR